ncbi:MULTISPECIES: hypothetical protein [Xanthomonas]|nr:MULTISPECIES: hypothetical protein [Xanthomonas]KLC44553.1 hypothetical protein XP1712_15555 [Xanthomonas perforans]QYF47546.1 hypothetical protein HZS93_07104 [Xanthomonas citri]KHM98128.1 hypothetical protein OR60_00900 [Xanthomonas vesicatoria]KLB02557.1 hypothetical protein SM19410_00915 [Xanthomonas hortorum pv. gardneri]KLB24724.1 hypothetical protein SM41311_05115 [Xanthomonas hortorum pv. gardneri]
MKFFQRLWDSGAWILPVIGVVSFCCVVWPAQTSGCIHLVMAGLTLWAMVVFYQNELRDTDEAPLVEFKPSRGRPND